MVLLPSLRINESVSSVFQSSVPIPIIVNQGPQPPEANDRHSFVTMKFATAAAILFGMLSPILEKRPERS